MFDHCRAIYLILALLVTPAMGQEKNPFPDGPLSFLGTRPLRPTPHHLAVSPITIQLKR